MGKNHRENQDENKSRNLTLTGGLILLLSLAACAPAQENESNSSLKESEGRLEGRVIYGSDDRLENYQASAALKTLAASTVALVKNTKLSQNSQGQIVLTAAKFGVAKPLCESEPYREQVAGAFCSGSLVGPDTIITAGHCITSAADCASVKFLFNYAKSSAGAAEKLVFGNDDVYSCKEIIQRTQEDTGADFAVIRLDRKVVGRSPLKVRKVAGTVSVGDSLVVIGHPAGLPQKIAGGAQVRHVNASIFVANLDTYGGNSGSAVFNLKSGEIEGILVRGENDFVRQGSCVVSQKCTENSCRGEDVTRIDQVKAFLPGLMDQPVDPPSTEAEVFSSSEKISIPDAPTAGIQSVLRVSSSVAGRRVQVKLDLTHPFIGDLLVELVSPDGRVVILHNRTGGSLDDLRGVYGVDLSSAQDLAVFSAASSGDWKLRVTDKSLRDIGTLNSWALFLK